jgi:DNA-binding winged helix-turn-helix (wHTH) protein
MPDTVRYRFGPFRLEPALRRLQRDSVEITLPPKAFDVLVLLLRSRDRVLTKQELLDAVWADTAVTDNTLTQRVREIREALGDDAQEPRYVGTVSRVGYRFVGDVAEESSAPSPRHEPVADVPQASLSEPILAAEPRFASTVLAGEEVTPSVVRLRQARRAVYAAAIGIVVVGGFAVWFGGTRQPAVDGQRRIESIAVLPLENLSQDAHKTILPTA